LQALHDLYPEAPIYTSIFWPEALPPSCQEWDVRPSSLDRLPLIRQHHQWFLPLYPYAFEQFDLSDYDVVISVTSGFAHGVITHPHTLHICYCLTPARFLWGYHRYVEREDIGRLARLAVPLFVHRLRIWDRLAADRVDHFVAISGVVHQRIAKFYRRDAQVIHPPVEIDRFSLSKERGDYFLIASRLVPYKRIDLAVQAFSQLGLPLWIIGDGRDRPALESMAASNVRFLGRVGDEELARYVSGCRAFIFPGEEDFGIAPLEAQAAGRPVIAYAAGGALETVVEGVSGLLFHEPTAESLAAAVARLDSMNFDPVLIREHAQKYDRSAFQRTFAEFVRSKCAEFRGS
jgi:glycosyltransferase involved in cell wall biosynthesis